MSLCDNGEGERAATNSDLYKCETFTKMHMHVWFFLQYIIYKYGLLLSYNYDDQIVLPSVCSLSLYCRAKWCNWYCDVCAMLVHQPTVTA